MSPDSVPRGRGNGLGAQRAVSLQSHSLCEESGIIHGMIFSTECPQVG